MTLPTQPTNVQAGDTGALQNWDALNTFYNAYANVIAPLLANYLTMTGNLSGLTDRAVARLNLGLGTIATADTTAYVTPAQMQAAIAAAIAGAATVPGQPTATVGTPSSGSVSVAFVAPSNGGSAITGYTAKIYAFVSGGSPGTPTQYTNTGASSPIAVTIPNGVTYYATVYATNAVGNSVESSPSPNFIAPSFAPAAPTIGSVISSGTGASVSFIPGNDGGSPITGYTVTCTSSDGGTTRTGTGATSPIAVASLTAAKHYTATVHATNAAGNSAESSASTSFLTGSNPTTGAAKSQAGLGPTSNYDSIKNLKAEELKTGRQIRYTAVYGSQVSTGTSGFDAGSIWGATSDSSGTASDGSHCLGYEAAIKARVQLIMNVPLAYGTAAQGGGQSQSAAFRLQHLDYVLNDTTDGTNSVIAAQQLAYRTYYRDRNIATTVASGSNAVNVLTDSNFVAGTGTLNVASSGSFASTGTLFVNLTGTNGVVKIPYTGKGSGTFTGCGPAVRCTVGGGTGTGTVSTAGYVGSGTGWTTAYENGGWEHDGDWYPWGVHVATGDTSIQSTGDRGQAQLSAKYVATKKHVVDNFRAYGWDGYVSILSCDQTLFQARATDTIAALASTTTADGLARYIQTLGLDFYDDNGGGINTGWSSVTNTWTNPTTTWQNRLAQLQAHQAIAVTNGLSVCYPEWACVSGSGQGNDDTTYIQGMADWENSLTAGSGSGQLLFSNYFAVFPTWSLDSGKPNSRTLYNTLFGA